MPKRRVILIVLGVVVAGAIVVSCRREREPEYGGKRLSEWVERASPFAIATSGIPHGLISPAEVLEPIRQIGTNAIPYLLDWIRYEPPAWKTKSIAFINRNFHSNLIDHKARRAVGASAAFCILGEKAEGAIPRLTVLMKDTKAPNMAVRADLTLYLLQAVLEKRSEVIGR